MTTSGVRIGVDVGGTFTDLVARDPSGVMWSCKVPSTPERPAAAVLNGIAVLERQTGPWVSLAHGTTLVTNAIVERRVASVGLITTRGFRDVLEIARQNRTHLYRLDLPAKPEPLVPRHLRLEIGERLGPEGEVLVPLALEELAPLVDGVVVGSAFVRCLEEHPENPAPHVADFARWLREGFEAPTQEAMKEA